VPQKKSWFANSDHHPLDFSVESYFVRAVPARAARTVAVVTKDSETGREVHPDQPRVQVLADAITADTDAGIILSIFNVIESQELQNLLATAYAERLRTAVRLQTPDPRTPLFLTHRLNTFRAVLEILASNRLSDLR
jgi:hypothetical protein